MFRNSSSLRRVVYTVGPINILSIVVILVCILLYIFKPTEPETIKTFTQLDNFANYIYDYALEIQQMGDDEALMIMNAFTFDFYMLDVQSYDRDGNPIPEYTWYQHTEAFMDVILQVQQLAVLTCNPSSKLYKNVDVWKIVRHFITQVMSRISIPPSYQTYPFGTNWYQFAITFPRFLVIVAFVHRKVFGKNNIEIENIMAMYCKSYIKEPPSVNGADSINYHRDGPNAVMMSIPHIGANLLMQTYREDNIVQYVKNYVNLNTVSSSEGLRKDLGFVFHTSLRAYGYIASSKSDFYILGKFFNLDMSKIQEIFNVLEHPTISRHFSALFTRSGSCTSRETGKLGFYTIDSIRVVSVKTNDWILSFNGQAQHLCFYESDKSYDSWPLCWLMFRDFMYADSDEKWYRQLVTRYPGVVSYGNQLWSLPSTTSTTTTFAPNSSHCMIVKLGDAIGMYNKYEINRPEYKIDITELTLVTPLGIHIAYKIQFDEALNEDNPICVAVNLGKIKPGQRAIGIGESFVFDKTCSYVYTSGSTVSKVVHPATQESIDSLQVVPTMEIDGENYVMKVSFSNLHNATNEALSAPTTTLIETNKLRLEFDPLEPNFLTLQHGRQVAITRFAQDFVPIVYIPTAFVVKRFGEGALTGKTITNARVAETNNGGNFITFNI